MRNFSLLKNTLALSCVGLLSGNCLAIEPEMEPSPWLKQAGIEPRRTEVTDPLDFARIKATGNDADPQYASGRDAELIAAAGRSDLKAVERLLKEGANANTRDVLSLRPIMHAARNGSTEIMRMLLDRGADPNVKSQGFTPLGIAALNGFHYVAELLIKAGARLDTKGDNGFTPLMNASLMNHKRTVEVLLRHDPDMELTNREGMTALSIAASEGHTESLEAMLKHGVDPNLIDRNKNPPLFWAVFRGQRGAVRMLLEYGAEPGTMAVDL